jgi:hypothetical protein
MIQQKLRSLTAHGNRVAAVALASLLGVAVGLSGTASAGASVTVTSHFVWTANASNTSGDTAFIVNGATNALPNDVLFVTPNWDPTDLCGCVYDNHPVGVWYDSGNKEWAVFNEDGSAMTANEGFNVLAVPSASTSAFVWTSTTSNSAGDFTLINSPLTNGQPKAQLQVTQDWNPGGVGGAYNPHNVGVWYDSAAQEWGIFNEDTTTMSAGLSFNVLVGAAPSNGGKSVVLRTTTSDQSGDTVFISNAETTGNPNTVVFATQNWNPGDVGGTYNNNQMGVWFDGSVEGVFDESGSTPPLKSAYNLLVFSS